MRNFKFIKVNNDCRIDFLDQKGKKLNYLRFEHINCEDNCPRYIGAINRTEKAKLKKLRNVINDLLGDK